MPVIVPENPSPVASPKYTDAVVAGSPEIWSCRRVARTDSPNSTPVGPSRTSKSLVLGFG